MTDEARPHVTPALLALISHVSSRLPELADALGAQAAAAVVVRDAPTMVDVAVPDSAPRVRLQDGPLPVSAMVHDETGDLVGEILVWIRDGRLIGLEHAWFTDAPPAEWPPPSRVRLS